MRWWKRYGWAYNPFAHLDAARDPHLLDYLIWPGQVDWQGRQPVVVLAPPGGGKTALRVALTQYALQTYGAVAPVVVVPERPPIREDVLLESLARGVARRTFWQALQFFDLLPWHEDAQILHSLATLWRAYLGWPWEAVASWMQHQNWDTLEYGLGPSFSPREKRDISRFLSVVTPAVEASSGPRPSAREAIETGLYLLREHLGAHQVWLLLDGLDGFPETAAFHRIWPVFAFLLEAGVQWAEQGAYLKAFLPWASREEVPTEALRMESEPWVFLEWSEPMLIQMVRLRVRAASQGLMDSLDPLAHPDLRPVEVRLVQLLPQKQRWPREVIHLAHRLLENAGGKRLQPEHWARIASDVREKAEVSLKPVVREEVR